METETKSAFQIGKEFEMKCADIVRRDWGYKVVNRSQQASRSNMRGTNVDLIGKKMNQRANFIFVYGIILTFFSAPFLILWLISYLDNWESVNPDFFLFIFFGLAAIGISIMFIGGSNMYDYLWIECKGEKKKTDYNQVNKFVSEKIASKMNKRKFKANRFVLISKTGFIDNAYDLAIRNGIECYIYDNDKLIKFELYK